MILPEVAGDDDALVASGQVSIVLSIDPATLSFGAGVEGELVFRVTRPDQGTCYDPDVPPDGEFPSTFECYDELTLTVGATVEVNPTSGSASVGLFAEVSGWDNAFGLEWLDVHQLRLELSIVSEPTGVGVEVDIAAGFFADEVDITFAASATFTANAPWIVINGLTAGTTNGISLKQIGDLVGTDTSALPDLSIRNAWFAWGIEEDTDNCIIRGVAISAELHLGAVADGSVEPGCSAGNNPIENLDTASCADSDTCLAGILMRVNPDQQEFRAEGFITGFDAGPISFDDTEISLVVSPTLQRFTLMGELVDQGAVVPNGVVTLRARHARIGTDINSVVPRCVELKPVDPHPDPPTQCPAGAIDFEGRTLLNLTSSRLIDTARVIDPGTYRVTLFSADLLHAPGYQTSQTEERWSVELLDATGTVLYSSPLISDLPNAMTFLAEQVDLEADVPAGVTTVRARHAQIGTNINSVTPCVLLERVESDNEVSTVGQQGSTTGLQ